MDYPKIYAPWKRAQEPPRLFLPEWAYPEFEYLASLPWDWYEKVDGMNVRVGLSCAGFSFYGRTRAASIPGPLLLHLGELFVPLFDPLYERFKEVLEDGGTVCFYGEGYGGKIQRGGRYRQDQSFLLFDIRTPSHWLYQESVSQIATELGIPRAAWRGRGSLWEAREYLQEQGSRFFSAHSTHSDCPAEGLILRPVVEMLRPSGSRIITKLKVRDFSAALLAAS